MRELRNVADRFVLGMWTGDDDQSADVQSSGSLADRIDAFERSVIASELSRNDGSMKLTYEALGISRKGLYDKMRRLGLSAGDDDDG